jgi:hypothetical protein
VLAVDIMRRGRQAAHFDLSSLKIRSRMSRGGPGCCAMFAASDEAQDERRLRKRLSHRLGQLLRSGRVLSICSEALGQVTSCWQGVSVSTAKDVRC